MWLSLVERSVRDREVVGSNPAIPTIWLKAAGRSCDPPFFVSKKASMLNEFLHWLGLGLCHQVAARSYFGGGVQAPVCVRDTGIYVGFALAFVLIALMHKGERPRGFAKPHVWVVMGLFLAFMGWDGVSSYAGLRETTNGMRLLSGLGVGFSVAAIITPMLNDEVWTFGGNCRVLDPVWRFWTWLLAVPAAYGVVSLLGPRLGVAFPVAIAVCIVATLTAINLVIVSMLPAFDRKASSLRQLVLPITIACAIAFVEILLAGQLRIALDSLARRLGG